MCDSVPATPDNRPEPGKQPCTLIPRSLASCGLTLEQLGQVGAAMALICGLPEQVRDDIIESIRTGAVYR